MPLKSRQFYQKIRQTLRLLTANPRLFWRYFLGYAIRLSPGWIWFKPKRKVVKINNVLLNIDYEYLGLNLFTKQMLFGVYEIATVAAIKKFLNPGDTFIDVGANIGYLSAMAAGVVGESGQVHAFEPIPQYFTGLKQLAELNPGHKIIATNAAVGEAAGTAEINFVKPPFYGSSTLLSEILAKHGTPKECIEKITVPMITLGQYILQNQVANIKLIKIDVEGWEAPVLLGLEPFLKSSGAARPPIICEISPLAYSLNGSRSQIGHSQLGLTSQQLIDYMASYGYEAYDMMNYNKKIDITRLTQNTNVLFRNIS